MWFISCMTLDLVASSFVAPGTYESTAHSVPIMLGLGLSAGSPKLTSAFGQTMTNLTQS